MWRYAQKSLEKSKFHPPPKVSMLYSFTTLAFLLYPSMQKCLETHKKAHCCTITTMALKLNILKKQHY